MPGKTILSEFKKRLPKGFLKSKAFYVALTLLVSFAFGMAGGVLTGAYFYLEVKDYFQELNFQLPEKETAAEYLPQTTHEEKIVQAVAEASPSVVSIIITKNLPVIEQYYYSPFEGFFGDPFFEFEVPQRQQEETEETEVGWGSGFVISEDGMILTNKHVVSDEEAEYTVLTNDGERLPAEVLARDPVKDLAIIKVESEEEFEPLALGDSDELQPGQTAIAIGNALGEFKNTVSVGVISGLQRTITASDGSQTEVLENVIQTDAAINEGNSGGPLLNLKGEVVGVNVATAQTAENIGFAVPINEAKKDIEQVKTLGKIVYPFLGIYYTAVTSQLQEEHGLPVDYGAWVGRNAAGEKTETAVFPDSAADKAGLKRDDIILEFDGREITTDDSLAEIIVDYQPGDSLVLKILRAGETKFVPVTLGEQSG